MEAVVVFDYTAQDSNELSLCKGDIITKIKIMKGGWWEGTTHKDGKRGFFPDNYVKVISHDPKSTSHETLLRGKKFRVQYDYIPANADELELHVNDIVEVISEIEEGWWEGKLGRTIGVFPSNFVTEMTDAEVEVEKNSSQCSLDINKTETCEKISKDVINDGPVLPPKPAQVKKMCIALFPYDAKHDDELTLKENDIIWLLSTDLPDKGWWKGQLNGKIGVFPDNFVKVIAINEDSFKLNKPSSVEITNNSSDDVPKLFSNNIAALRKSLQPGTVNPETLCRTSSKSVSTCEELNFASETAFVTNECKSVTDGAISSKVHKINSFKGAIDNEPANYVSQSNSNQEVDLNSIQRSELLTHPTASRVKAPKRRPPSGLNFKDVDDTVSVNSEITKFSKGISFVNDTTSLVHDKMRSIPWVHELKLNQAKKMSTTQANLKNGFISTGSNVTFRFQRPISLHSDDSFDQNIASTYQKSNLTSATNDYNSLTNINNSSAPPDHENEKFVIISTNDWNALNEKVNNLEKQLERQAEFFYKSIDHLKTKLEEEVEHRLEMKNEMEKVLDLVTQV